MQALLAVANDTIDVFAFSEGKFIIIILSMSLGQIRSLFPNILCKYNWISIHNFEWKYAINNYQNIQWKRYHHLHKKWSSITSNLSLIN